MCSQLRESNLAVLENSTERTVLMELRQASQSGSRHHVSYLKLDEVCIILCVDNGLPTGYAGSRQTRCTDRFVRYPYPKVLFSNYKQNYYGKLTKTDVKSHKEAFNLEKESKIINPHNMDL